MKELFQITLVLIGLSCTSPAWLNAQNLAAGAAPAKPNVIVILVDDLGFSDLGCYGSEIRTPNLDRLAAEGLRFTQFYNCAVCTATRAALTTGLHPRRGDGELRENMVTLGEIFQQAGYQTALVGKWHLGALAPRRPTDRGFSEYFGLLSGCCNHFNPGLADPEFYNGGKKRPFAHNDQLLTTFPADYYSTDAFTDHAVRIVEGFAGSGKPFFLHVCYTAPHFPLQAKPDDIARYRGKYEAGYFALREARYRRQIELGVINPRWKLSPADHKLGPALYDYDIEPWDTVEDPQRQRRRMEVYAAMVDCIDQGVGRILAALDRLGAAQNTLVMFLSDNGGCAALPTDRAGWKAYNRDLPGAVNTYDFCGPGWGWAQCTPFRRYKAWDYEGGIATPLVARWPRVIRPNTITHEVGHVVDFMPTFVDLAGAKYPETFRGKAILPMEGKSLLPILEQQPCESHSTLCWALYGNRAVRQGQWKLVWGVSRGQWELYDMQTDRTETQDLSAEHPDRVAAMRSAWLDWARRTEISLTDDAAKK